TLPASWSSFAAARSRLQFPYPAPRPTYPHKALRPPPRYTLFPYTTLFRSDLRQGRAVPPDDEGVPSPPAEGALDRGAPRADRSRSQVLTCELPAPGHLVCAAVRGQRGEGQGFRPHHPEPDSARCGQYLTTS